MTFSSAHYMFAFGGSLGAGEQWSVGLRMGAAVADPSQAAEMTALNGLSNVLTTEWQKIGNPTGRQAKILWLKLNKIGLDGKYAQPYTNVLDRPALSTSTGAGQSFANALVVTLRTGNQRGLARTGRIYLPVPHLAPDVETGHLSPSQTASAATWAGGLISALNAAPGVGDVVVCSAVGTGAIRRVTSVDVGSVIDTMRSRRGALKEARSAGPVTVSTGTGDF